MGKSSWKSNITIYKIDSTLNWFHVAIGVWPLIWGRYLSLKEIALIYSISLFWGLLLELPSGALADMIGRKKTIVIGRILNVLGFVLLSMAVDFKSFLLGNMLYQTMWALESGALSALLYDSLKENGKEGEYKKTETATYFYCTVGMAVASIIGGFLYRVDDHLPYMASVIVSTICLGFTLMFEEPGLDSEKFSLKSYLKQNVEGVKHIFANEKIRAVSFFSLLGSFVGYCGLWYLYEPRLAAGGFDGRWMGILVAGTYGIRAIGTKLIPKLDKFIRDDQVPLFLAVSQTVGSFMSFFGGRAAAIATVYSRKFADGFRVPILATVQNENIESKYRATALSAIALITNLLVAIAGPVIGIFNEDKGVAYTVGLFGWVGLLVVTPMAMRLGRVMRADQRKGLAW